MERPRLTPDIGSADPPPSYSSAIRSSVISPSAPSPPTGINAPYPVTPSSNPPYPVTPDLNRPPYPVTPESCQPPYPIPEEERLPRSRHRTSMQEYTQIPFPMPVPMLKPMPISMPQPMSIPGSPSTFQKNRNSVSESDREADRSVGWQTQANSPSNHRNSVASSEVRNEQSAPREILVVRRSSRGKRGNNCTLCLGVVGIAIVLFILIIAMKRKAY